MYLAGLAIPFVGAGGLDPAAYDCQTEEVCSPDVLVGLLALIAAPSMVAAVVLAALSLVALHSLRRRWMPWVGEGFLAAGVGITVSVLVTAALVAWL